MRPTTEFRKQMLARRAQLLKRAEESIAHEVEWLGSRVPKYEGHPILPHLVRAWWERASGDPQPGWHEALPAWCVEFFENASWLRTSKHDDGRLSPRRCRMAMGKQAKDLSDQDLRFLRDQLYVLAETLVDRVAGATS